MSERSLSRRDLLRGGRDVGGLLALSALPLEAAQTALRSAPDVYQSIGVRPLINARGTFTIISGSLMLPEVRAAMDAAAKHYVHLDELAEAVGARLAVLTKAEWGLVTAGCSAGLTLATAACVAGGNPDLHIRVPNLAGFPRDEVIIPKHSRNVYDAALRTVGVRVIEVETVAELESALGPRTAMIYIMASPRVDASPLNLKAMAAIAQSRGVPILVDAAAEVLTIPNVHLQNGASLVGYSGGKCLRGPQTAGLLLGRKDLVKAAWVHSAPHHGPGRALKVGKEEAIGMLMAVEMWVKRDHDAEWKQWTSMLDHVDGRMRQIAGVTTVVSQPNGLSNRTPSLRVLWDPAVRGLTSDAVVRTLLETEPRIATAGTRQDKLSGVSITPYMMSPGDEKIVADRLAAVLSAGRPSSVSARSSAPVADVTGRWDVRIDYAAARSTHTLYLRQRGSDIDGSHQGEFITRDVSGTIDGDAIRLRSAFSEEHGDAITFVFTGKLTGSAMSGALDMGEYLGATWTATRRG
ncbi:MAG: aminotransferase class V-fold PLP-dependent enzyme [Vicinamibacterales bacterium]|nr:aminotransferase class V-fold PLP-dependent enzyme [Vicinamibacterales bacterium]